MKQVNSSHAVVGGFAATLVTTALLYLMPLAGGPKLDIAALLGSLLGHGTPATLSAYWWAGMVWHFVDGTIIFSILYAYFAYSWLPGSNWLRGMNWGILVWLLSQVTLMPVTGHGVFDDHVAHPASWIVASLVLSAIYGSILGQLAGDQAERRGDHISHPA